MDQTRAANARYLVAAVVGAGLFWGTLVGVGTLRPPGPHPGLRDDALKAALRDDRTHRALSYLKARKALFGQIDGDGRSAECAYTGHKLEYFSQPLPNNAAVEHAWPLTRLPAEGRTDLHHMAPVTSEARVARLNLHYGKVLVPVWSEGGSRSGPSSHAMPVFEVRREQRGDVARAMFYVATMYELSIPAREERTLRRWHDDDPVDKAEKRRNDQVAKLQSSRNPFIDHPGLTERISDF